MSLRESTNIISGRDNEIDQVETERQSTIFSQGFISATFRLSLLSCLFLFVFVDSFEFCVLDVDVDFVALALDGNRLA